jgi:hypothetical protein
MDSKQRLSLTLIELSDARRCKMKKSLYKTGAAVFVAVFVAASFGFSTQAAEKKMTQDGPVEIIFKFDRATGTLIEARGINTEKVEEVDPKEIERIYKGQDGFRYVVTLLHAHSSPGSIYYYDPVLRKWVRIRWPQ